MQTFFSELDDDIDIPSILVVGCGRIGESLVRALIDHAPHREVNIYVTDSDKERARKLSEYRVSQVTPIKWRYAHDTPEDVDVIVVCVDHDSEHKVIDRLALAKKPFVSLSDDASVYDSYEVYENDFRNSGVHGIVGTGLIPGAANVLVNHCALYFDRVFDITVERLGFVSSSSLASVKRARRETSISVRDGYLDDSRRNAGNALSWFPPHSISPNAKVLPWESKLYIDGIPMHATFRLDILSPSCRHFRNVSAISSSIFHSPQLWHVFVLKFMASRTAKSVHVPNPSKATP